jgi:hypothetical protein
MLLPYRQLQFSVYLFEDEKPFESTIENLASHFPGGSDLPNSSFLQTYLGIMELNLWNYF